ncbi:MAG: hypothetical protein CSA20_08715 [Deltaproteobacteria bacterium]|nr:MAG: hypothetical protein CSA20_08715 [Deltaproteobacteria bacterium]
MPKKPEYRIMIGVSTQQNSTNLVPFLQSECDTLLLLETTKAENDKWAKGFKDVLQSKGKTFKTLFIGEGLELAEILEELQKEIKNIEDENGEKSIVWNIGGGQKMQTIALMTTFEQRRKNGCKDQLCYTEPQARKTVEVSYNNLGIQSDLKRTTVPELTLKDILKTFRYKIIAQQVFWKRIGEDSGKLYQNNLLTDAQFNHFMDYDNRQDMMEYTYQRDQAYKKDISMPLNPSFFGSFYDPDKDKTNGMLGYYFERVMQTEVTRLVAKDPASHRINQVWSVEIEATDNTDTKQEFDILLVTDFGTLIALDAKTFSFGKKDEDARTLNLYKASGFYTDFCSVFPFFKKDLNNKDSMLNSNNEWQKLKNRPFEIEKRGGKMFAFCEETAGDLVLPRKVNKKKENLTLTKLSDMLDKLKLKV